MKGAMAHSKASKRARSKFTNRMSSLPGSGPVSNLISLGVMQNVRGRLAKGSSGVRE